MKKIEEKSTNSISKIIHFIWAGGTFNMQLDDIEVISQWANKNPTIDIYLWVDKKTGSKDLIAYYKEKFGKHDITVFDENAEIQKKKTAASVIIKDISNADLRDKYVAYEIDKINPNYGASSDLLRYPILEIYGGAYFDSDVMPGKDSLVKICDGILLNSPMIYIDHYTQQPGIKEEKLKIFTINTVGNDTFICSKNNPLMREIAKKSRERYSTKKELSIATKLAHSGKNIQDLTVQRTGPVLIQEILKSGKLKGENIVVENYNCIIKRVRDGEIELTNPKANTARWLNAKINQHDEIEHAISAIEKSILFEAENFHMLRLDDHIDDLIASCKKIEITPETGLKYLSIILDKNEKLISSEVIYVQTTGKYQETIEFCLEKKMKTLFDLEPEICISAIVEQGYFGKFIIIENIAKNNQQVIEIANKNGIPPEIVILDSQRQQVKENLCIQLKQSVDFLGRIIEKIDFFKEKGQNEKVRKFITERLDKSIVYSECLNPKVDKKYSIDIDKIKNIYKIATEKNEINTENKVVMKE